MAVDISRFTQDGIGQRINQIKSLQFASGSSSPITLNQAINSIYSMVFPVIGGDITSLALSDTQITFSVHSQSGKIRNNFIVVEFEPNSIKQVITGSLGGTDEETVQSTDTFSTAVVLNNCILSTNYKWNWRDWDKANNEENDHEAYYISNFTSTSITGGWTYYGGPRYTSPVNRFIDYKIIEFK
jgi:hypothetical protein